MGSGGKGKTETITDLSVTKIFNDKNMYASKLISLHSKGVVNSENIVNSLIQDKLSFTTDEFYKKMGYLGLANFVSIKVTDYTIKSAIENKYNIKIDSLTWSDDIVSCFALGSIKYFLLTLEQGTNTKDFTITAKRKEPNTNGDYVDDTNLQPITIYNGELWKYVEVDSVKYYGLDEDIFTDENENKHFKYEFTITSDNYTITTNSVIIDDKEYILKEPVRYVDDNDEPYIKLIELDDKGNETDNEINYSIINDERKFYSFIAKYTDEDGNEQTITDIITDDEILKVAEDVNKCLVIPLKINGEMTTGSKQAKATMLRMGMMPKTFDDLESNTDLKYFIMSMITGKDEKEWNRIIILYNHDITIQTDRVKLEFLNTPIYSTSDDGTQTIVGYQRKISIDDKEPIASDYLIIPFSEYKYLALKDFYDFIQQYLKSFNYSEKEVHLKWYQTDLFSFVTFVAGAVIAIATGQVELFVAITATTMAINEFVNDQALKLILTIAVLLTDSYYAGEQSLSSINTPSTYAKIGQTIFKYYNTERAKEAIKEANEISNKAKEELEKLENNNTIINPFNSVQYNYDKVYNIAYELPYTCYDELIYKGYDYDRY